MSPSLPTVDTCSQQEVSHNASHPASTHSPHTGDGKVYVWDMSTRDCVHSFNDEGCLTGTKLAVSPNSQYIACGSDSGVVNVYETEQCLKNASPQPLRAVSNLTTSIDHMCFNSTRYGWLQPEIMLNSRIVTMQTVVNYL